MTRQSSRILGVSLLAAVCLAVETSVSASASDTPAAEAGGGKVAKMARGRPYCPPRTVCLYPHANFEGIQRRYNCRGFRPGTRRHASLETLFPWNTVRGVSSYQNARGVGNAVMTFVRRNTQIGEDGRFKVQLARNRGVPRMSARTNDVATELDLTC
jgi:hypothetical protein